MGHIAQVESGPLIGLMGAEGHNIHLACGITPFPMLIVRHPLRVSAGNIKTSLSAWTQKRSLNNSTRDVNLLLMRILQHFPNGKEKGWISRQIVPRSLLRQEKRQTHFPNQPLTCPTTTTFLLGLMN